MPKPSQAIFDYYRLGPAVPDSDPWGKGVYDSACDLYDSEGNGNIGPPKRQLDPITAPLLSDSPDLNRQWLIGVQTPPCDRIALYCQSMRPIASDPAIIFNENLTVPSPWQVQLLRGMNCVEELNTATPTFKYAPTSFADVGLMITLFGCPLSMSWTIRAYQTVTAGVNVPMQMRIRIVVDRIGCCPEGSQLGPNSSTE